MTSSPISIVTGAAGGIGRGLVDRLLERGHRVLATDLADPVADAARPDRLAGRALDVRDPAQWTAAFDDAETRWGPVDQLFNVAGYVWPGWIHETPIEEISRHVDVNTKGVMYGAREAARRMVARRSGHIVNVASLAGVAPIPGLCLYSASKFAVRGFSLATAEALRPHGVHVTVVCPDAVDTAMLDLQIDCPEAALTFSGLRPLTVDEVVRAIVDDALRRRPVEVLLPRARGLLARLAGLVPELGKSLGPVFTRLGREGQARARARRARKQ